MNLSSDWVRNLNGITFSDSSLIFDFFISLPPLWVNHFLFFQVKLSPGWFLSLSLDWVLSDSVSPSWRGSTSGRISGLGQWLLNLLFLRWLFALLASKDSIISFRFEFRFWIYLRATLDSLLFLFCCFVRFEKGLHHGWRLELVKITMSSIYKLDWSILCRIFFDYRSRASLHHDFVNGWRLRKLWRNWILIIFLRSHLRLTFHKVNLFGFGYWLSLNLYLLSAQWPRSILELSETFMQLQFVFN